MNGKFENLRSAELMALSVCPMIMFDRAVNHELTFGSAHVKCDI